MSDVQISVALDSQDAESGAKRLNDALNQTQSEASATSGKTKNLNRRWEQFSRTSRQVSSRISGITSKLGSLQGMLGGIAVGAGFYKALSAFSEMDQGLIEIQKTADIAGKELDQLESNIRDLGREIPVTTKQLLNTAAAAGRLGVRGVKDITNFTETVGKLGTVSDLQGEKAASTLARLLNVANESTDQVDELGSVIVRLGNNLAATESEIAKVASEIGRGTANFSVGSEQAAALGAAMKSMGARAELSGSSVARAMIEIEKALGSGGEKMQMLADLTNMTGEQLRATFERDAMEVFTAFIRGAGRASERGESAISILEDLGLSGTEAAKGLTPLINNTEAMNRAFKMANEEVEDATALNKEAMKATESFASQMRMTLNAVDEIAAGIGEGLAPVIAEVTEDFRKWVDANQKFINQKLPGEILEIATATTYVMDTIEGIVKTTQVAGRGVAVGAAKMQKEFLELGETIINYPVDNINTLIEWYNKLPAILRNTPKLPTIGMDLTPDELKSELDTLEKTIQEGLSDIDDILTEPFAGRQFRQRIQGLKNDINETNDDSKEKAQELGGVLTDYLFPSFEEWIDTVDKGNKKQDENAKVTEKQKEILKEFSDFYQKATLSNTEYELAQLDKRMGKFRKHIDNKEKLQEAYKAKYKDIVGWTPDMEGFRQATRDISGFMDKALFKGKGLEELTANTLERKQEEFIKQVREETTKETEKMANKLDMLSNAVDNEAISRERANKYMRQWLQSATDAQLSTEQLKKKIRSLGDISSVTQEDLKGLVQSAEGMGDAASGITKQLQGGLDSLVRSAEFSDSFKGFGESAGNVVGNTFEDILSKQMGDMGSKLGVQLGKSIGGAAGGAVGGPIGAAAGQIVGQLAVEGIEAAGRISGRETYEASVKTGRTTGTVLGEPDKLSKSIKESIGVLESFKDANTILLSSINANLSGMQASMSRAIGGIVRETPQEVGQSALRGNAAQWLGGEPGWGAGRTVGNWANIPDTMGQAGRGITQLMGQGIEDLSSTIGLEGLGNTISEGVMSLGETYQNALEEIDFFGAYDYLGKVTGELGSEIFGGDKSIKQRGISFKGDRSIEELQRGQGVGPRGYAKVKTEGGWFSSGSTSMKYQQLDRDVRNNLNNVFQNVSDTLVDLGKGLGADMQEVLNYTFDLDRINLKGLSPEKKQEKLQAELSAQMDVAVEDLFGDALKKYQKVDEGLMETASRVLSVKNTMVSLFERTQTELDETAQGTVDVAMKVKDAFGGMEQAQQAVGKFYQSFVPDDEKRNYISSKMSEVFVEVNKSIPDTREGFYDLVSSLDLTTESGREAYATLTKASGIADKYYDKVKGISEEMQTIAEGRLGIRDALDKAFSPEAFKTSMGIGENLGLDWNIDTEGELRGEFRQLNSLLKEGTIESGEYNKILEQLISSYKESKQQAKEMASAQIEFQDALGEAFDPSTFRKSIGIDNLGLDYSIESSREFHTEFSKLNDRLEAGRINTQQYNAIFSELISSYEEAKKQAKEMASAQMDMRDALGKTFSPGIFKESLGIDEDLDISWNVDNTRQLKGEFRNLNEKLESGKITTSQYNSIFSELISSYEEAKQETKAVAEATKEFKDIIGENVSLETLKKSMGLDEDLSLDLRMDTQKEFEATFQTLKEYLDEGKVSADEFNTIFSQISDSFEESRKEAKSTLDEVISKEEKLINARQEAAQSLEDLRVNLKTGDLAPTQSAEFYEQRYSELLRGVRQAEGPEKTREAVSEYTDFAKNYLDFMQDYGGNYQEKYRKVMQDIGRLEETVSPEEQQVNQLETIKDNLDQINNERLPDLLKAWRDYRGTINDDVVEGSRASGGSIYPGNWLVGESGPEIVSVGQKGQVQDNEALKQAVAEAVGQAMGGENQNIQVNVYPTIKVGDRELEDVTVETIRTNAEAQHQVRRVANNA